VGNNPFNRNDPSGLIAADMNMLGGKIGGYLDGANLPSLNPSFVNATAGFGDGISSVATLGMYSTANLRNSLGINGGVDQSSASYAGGKYAGYAWGAGTLIATGAAGSTGKSASEAFFEETTLHPRVLKQFESGDNHAFPALIDELAAEYGTVARTVDSRGNAVEMLTIDGSRNGVPGVYEYIKNGSNQIYHRFFNPTH